MYKVAFLDGDGTLWRRSDGKYCFTSLLSKAELARSIENGIIIPTLGAGEFLQFLALSNIRIVLISENHWKIVTYILEHPRIALDRFFKRYYEAKNEYEMERIYLIPYNSYCCYTKAECVRHYLTSYNIKPSQAFFVDNEVRDLKALEASFPELKTILMRTESKEKWRVIFDSFEELSLKLSAKQIP
jgi:histidinol phosphatase-like enzyme